VTGTIGQRAGEDDPMRRRELLYATG
jgi:hypothetical protein